MFKFFELLRNAYKHNTMTRNNGYKVILPKIRLENSREAFYYMGAKLYNSLPLDTRKTGH